MELMEELMSIDNKEMLTKIKAYVKKIKGQEKRMASFPCRYTTEEAKQLLHEARQRTEKGEFITQEDAIKQMEEWI